MTQFDIDTIEKWRHSFGNKNEPIGVQEDIWDRVEWLKINGYDHFPNVQAVMGRRASKGMIGGILGAERIAHLISLDNPQAHYGVAEGKDIFLNVVATSLGQAKKFQFADIRQTVEQNPWFQPFVSYSGDTAVHLMTAADKRRILDLEARRMPTSREIATIRAVAMASVARSGRGGAAFCNFFDEFSHAMTTSGSQMSSSDIWDAYQPALDQFGKDAMTFVPSSPFTKIGKFYELYVQGSKLLNSYSEPGELFANLTSDPEMLILQLPSWTPYEDFERGPELVGVNFKRAIQYSPVGDAPENLSMARKQQADPQKFRVERAAQFADVVDGYLDPEMVDQMFAPFWNGRVLKQQTSGDMHIAYTAHADPAKVNDNFSLAIGHIEQAPEPDKYGKFWNHVIIDYTHVWKPTDFSHNHNTIDYVQVEHELEGILDKYRSLELLTFDQYNSISLIQMLTKYSKEQKYQTRIREETFTAKSNKSRDETFKMALNLGWIHSPMDTLFNEGQGCLLMEECKFLTSKNGKVDHQSTGPVTTNDVYASCFDDQTQVLTETGWKLFSDVSMNERVATTNSVGNLEFQYPTARIDRIHSGKMIKVKGKLLDFVVTPDHRMLTRNLQHHTGPTEWGYSFREAHELQNFDWRSTQVPLSSREIVNNELIETMNFKPIWDQPLATGTWVGRECHCGCKTIITSRRKNKATFVKGHGKYEEGCGWTPEKEQFLTKNYADMPMDELQHLLTMSSYQIYGKVRTLGLIKINLDQRVKDRPDYLPEVSTELFARFVGFWLGDGTKIKFGGPSGFTYTGYKIQLTQVKPEGCDYIENLFSQMNWSYEHFSDTLESGNERSYYYVKDIGLRSYVRSLQNPISHELRLPPECFTRWSREARLGLLEGLLASDGNGPDSSVFHNSSKDLIDDVQMLAQTLGMASSIQQRYEAGTERRMPNGILSSNTRAMYSIHLFKKNYTDISHDSHVSEIDYDGTVHCFTVPNGTLITRRNDRTLVAGNCSVLIERLLGKQVNGYHDALNQPIQMGMQGGVNPISNITRETNNPNDRSRTNRDRIEALRGWGAQGNSTSRTRGR